MLLRPLQAEFAAAALVFPGGAIDPGDEDAEWDALTGLSPEAAAELLAVGDVEGPSPRALLVGGVRELFEEAAILIGVDDGRLDRADAEAARAAVHGGMRALPAELRRLDLRLDLAAVVLFARWITPEFLPRRYDTWFFAARLPAGQEAVAAPGEVEALEWLTPAEALRRAESRAAQLMPPTIAALRLIDGHPDVAAALAGLRSKRDLRPILPRVVAAPDTERGVSVLMPGDPGYEP